jgi:hypothetical protein
MLTSLQTLPDNGIITYKNVFQQALVAPQDFTSVTTSQDMVLFGIPSNYVICAVKVIPVIAFVGASLSSITVQVGATGQPNAYSLAFELTQSASFQLSSPLWSYQSSAHDVIARFISTGASINAVTAGQVEITVQVRAI